MILDLDHEASLDPARSGAKAAWLARGRRAGLPVLPGFVVEAAVSRHHMAIGADALATRGSGGARLAVMSEPVPNPGSLVEAASGIGDRLVARSSTILEASAEWSGAFTSYLDLRPDELPKAVLGCWASAFSVSTLSRQTASGVEPGSFPMAVLVQRSLDPMAGGTARVGIDGVVTIHGIKGPPAPLLQGWSTGHSAVGGAGWQGEQLIELVGVDVLDEIAGMLRQSAADLGITTCEWAVEDRVWLLQVGSEPAEPEPTLIRSVAGEPGLIPIARAAARAPGRLGEELILPWAIAGLPEETPTAPPEELSPEDAAVLRDHLLAQVWDMAPEPALASARECMTGLLGPDPAPAVARARQLHRPDPVMAGRLLAHLDALLSPSHVTRIGYGRWEPFIASVVLSMGEHHSGTPASPGIGAGARAHIDTRDSIAGYRRRCVVTAPQPIPNLAPLLWDSTALVTETGSPAAHLFESARALAIPAVCGVSLPPGDLMVAVDGSSGVVATIPLNGEDDE